MTRRIGLAPMMALIVVLAVGLAALKAATEAAARLSIVAAVLALLSGSVGAIVRRPRGGWVGFAVFGWSYALVLFGVPILAAMLPTIAGEMFEVWQVDVPVAAAVARVHPEPPGLIGLPAAEGLTRSQGKFYREDSRSFTEIPFPPDEAATLNAHFDQQDRWRAWSDSVVQARKVAFALQGLTFALVGLVVGRALDRRGSLPS